MLNICQKCGKYHADKLIDPSGSYAICPACGYKHLFRWLPLLVCTGPSGSGKTAVCSFLLQKTQEFVIMESDILWRKEFDSPESNLNDYRNMWLRVCKNISQSGRPVLLCGSTNPGQFEKCIESRYFSSIHYIALVCDDDVLESRLKSRPSWRVSGSKGNIKIHRDWSHWFKNTRHEQDVTLLDTSRMSIEDAAEQVLFWAHKKFKNE